MRIRAMTVTALLTIGAALAASCGTSSKESSTATASDSQPAVTEPVTEADLPPPVVAAIKAHRRAIFVSGQKITRGDVVEYHLTLRGSRRTAMIVTPDGTVLSFE